VPLSQSPLAQHVRATADYARSTGISFVAGEFWYVWPVVHQLLADGRDSAFGTAPRSGGDQAAYRQKLDDQLLAGARPRAICVNDSVESCVTYLTYWTAPGWSAVPDGSCPVPEQPEGSTTASCQVLQFAGPSAR
jgi:hypothetical protein